MLQVSFWHGSVKAPYHEMRAFLAQSNLLSKVILVVCESMGAKQKGEDGRSQFILEKIHELKGELKVVVHPWFCHSAEMKVHKVKKMQNIIATSPCKSHITCKWHVSHLMSIQTWRKSNGAFLSLKRLQFQWNVIAKTLCT